MSACVCLSCEAVRQSDWLPPWWRWTSWLGVGVAMRNPKEYAAWWLAAVFRPAAPGNGGDDVR